MELLLKNNQCVLLHLTTSSLSYRNTLLPANAIKHGLLPNTQQRERERERVNTDVTDRLREIQMELLLKNNQCVLLHLTTSSLSYRNTLLPANAIKHGLLPYTQQRERERERVNTDVTDRLREIQMELLLKNNQCVLLHLTTSSLSYRNTLLPANAIKHGLLPYTQQRERERERVNTDVTDRLREIQMELLLKNNQCVLLHLITSSLSYRNTLLPANAIKHGLLPYTQQRERERELIQTSQTDWERYRWSCCSRTTNVFSYIW